MNLRLTSLTLTKTWVRTIRIRDIARHTSLINEAVDAIYISFNYTAVLETVYMISEEKIIHIHGSLHKRDDVPILGHGDKEKIERINEKIQDAEREYDEKKISICEVVKDYYIKTYKNINKYMYKLLDLRKKDINEINIIGHSLAGVDIPYFRNIDMLTYKKANWNVYFYSHNECQKIFDNLVSCGIDKERIKMLQAGKFYDL